jgi:pimeloyl-ACP methyl ester carboxylesterase
VGYAEYGDPVGRPVLHLHGFPSSRFEAQLFDDIASRLQARILVIERPGIGLSDFHSYTITSWPDIVREFADALRLDAFALMGLSAGGKYAAACAWKIPERLTAAGIVSGSCPYDLPGAKNTLGRRDALLYRLADKAPWLLRLMLWKVSKDVRANPASILSLFEDVSVSDKLVLERPDIQRAMSETVAGAFEQGTRGVAWDWRLEARPWGFSLRDVRMPVHVWHGEQDIVQPVEQGRILARELPNARAVFFADEGHISLIANRYEELLGTIVG